MFPKKPSRLYASFIGALLPLLSISQYTPIPTNIFNDASNHWYHISDKKNTIQPLPNQPRYQPSDITAIADNILLFQHNNGGWPKNYDMLAVLTPEQQELVKLSKSEEHTTFDNRTTYSHISYLAQVYTTTHIEKYKEAVLHGLRFILDAQYNNGGWPQYYPLEKGYSRHITYNDDAMAGIMDLLKNILDNQPTYSFVDDSFRKRLQKSFDKGLDCILKTQINDTGTPTVWCQQHDEVTLQPAWARAFEPPCICNGESVKIVQFLMSISHPSPEVVKAVQNAVAWFQASKITGITIQTIQAAADTSQYTVSHVDKIVVRDSSAPPIWTRYYELKTHRPMFCNRDSKIVYSLAEVQRERRVGYAWYTYEPQKVLDKYDNWLKKIKQ
ncbi:pectate lyase, PelA/Pel-15E family [Filimonas lacunae]|uniref:Pectate lyase, PelA/Pel-15E family n=1 Tax=Filimonas lacunae TaxID=477680 RepID=A0A173MMY2_9BACT|nr:pectate lyase [Filimonas lacunae]BAV08751.1 pectate lyase [Filimonas lacunae]SIS61119.1 pectate lyase, PelA/Pel-15E family [Filimonas lacunae]